MAHTLQLSRIGISAPRVTGRIEAMIATMSASAGIIIAPLITSTAFGHMLAIA